LCQQLLSWPHLFRLCQFLVQDSYAGSPESIRLVLMVAGSTRQTSHVGWFFDRAVGQDAVGLACSKVGRTLDAAVKGAGENRGCKSVGTENRSCGLTPTSANANSTRGTRQSEAQLVCLSWERRDEAVLSTPPLWSLKGPSFGAMTAAVSSDKGDAAKRPRNHTQVFSRTLRISRDQP
jgi:hypothetical protein